MGERRRKKHSKSDSIYPIARQLIQTAEQQLTTDQTLDDKQIHQLRVLTKKLRGLLQLYRPTVAAETLRDVERQIKSLANRFASARDSHVLAATLTELLKSHHNTAAEALQQQLIDWLSPATTIEQPPSADAVAAQLAVILGQWKVNLRDNGSGGTGLGLQYSYRKARRLARKSSREGDDDSFHRCRKWVKYHLYQCELTLVAPNKLSKRYCADLDALADQLGSFHDRCLLEQKLLEISVDRFANSAELLALHHDTLDYLTRQKADDKQACQARFETLFADKKFPLRER